jgi:hypothetical protein
MIQLYDKGRLKLLGQITDEEFEFLRDHLEEEGIEDDDYYIDRKVFEYLKENGMSSNLSKILEKALSEHDSVDITFKSPGEIPHKGERNAR